MTATGNDAEPSPNRPAMGLNRPRTWLAVIGAASLLPFIAKPFNVDDPVYLAIAKHIVKSPFDFYGFDINWYGTVERVSDFHWYAPGLPYFMAIVGSILGWSEIAMHAAFIIPAIAFLLGTYAVAKRLCDQPMLATVAAWFCPAVFVSATSVMTDISMAAFFVWAAALWMRGIDESRSSWLCAAVACAAMAGLMKYFGVAVIGVLGLYAIGRRHPLHRWVPLMAVPIVVLALYDVLTYAMYDSRMVWSSFGFADEGRGTLHVAWYEWLANGMSFLGGGVTAAALLALLAWRRSMWAVWSIAFVALLALFASIESYRGLTLHGDRGIDWAAAVHLAAFVTLGAQLMTLVLVRLVRDRKLEDVMLAAWIGGVFIFCAYVNWSITARTFVPLAPAAAILAVRAARMGDGRLPWRYGVTCVAAGLALFVAWGDQSWSRTVRDTAHLFNDRFRDWPSPVYFQGHWGFQHYADPEAMQQLDNERTVLHAGDIMITPRNNSVGSRLPEQFRARSDTLEAGEGRWASTMLGRNGVGFYSDLFGPLPFRIGPAPPELYYVTEVSPAIEGLNTAP